LYGSIEKHQFEFKEFDAFAEQIKEGNIEHAQLDAGTFDGWLIQLFAGPVMIGRHHMNRKILQKGTIIEGSTVFVMPGNMVQDFLWRKHQFKGPQIGINNSNTEFHALTRPGFFGLSISINNKHLIDLAEKAGHLDTYRRIQKQEFWEIDKIKIIQIQKNIISLTHNDFPNPEAINVELPLMFLDAFSETGNLDNAKQPRSRERIFRNVLDYIQANLNSTINLLDVCDEIKISERTLRYVFNEKTGLSPRNYIKRLKLNEARKMIKSSDPDQKNISDIASQWGFWHSGQFAADYKGLFGKLPSDT